MLRSSVIGHAGDAIRPTPDGLTTPGDHIIVLHASTKDVVFARSRSESLAESDDVSIDSLEFR